MTGLLAAAGAARAQSDAPEVYLLAGQSNMSGHGRLEELLPEERAPIPGVTLYGNDGEMRPAQDPLDDATGQIDAVSADPRVGVGPGMSFAREMRRLHPDREIVLVPCAKGGSSIGRWKRSESRDTLYGSCLARARAMGKVAGILWYQGEGDTSTVERAGRWSHAFTDLVAGFRSDLGDPALPVTFVQLAAPSKRADWAARRPGWETLTEAQAAVALPCVAMVRAGDLPLNADELHLSTAGQRRLGQRLGIAMAGLRSDGCR